MDLKRIKALLLEKGLVSSPNFEFTPLEGGVSSEIYLLKNNQTNMVIKKALPKLKTKDAWIADTTRNQVEQDFVEFVHSFIPSAVPEIIFSDQEYGFLQWNIWMGHL